MNRLKSISVFICLLAAFTLHGQSDQTIDKQDLKTGKWVSLVSTFQPNDEEHVYQLVFTNPNYRDSAIIQIDSLELPQCVVPNSIFFLNDSVGFLTAAGGCYLSYNGLFRTTDRGHSWQSIFLDLKEEDAGSLHLSRICNDNFHMYDDLRGMIVWKIIDYKIWYSVTNDGGLTWTLRSETVAPSNTHLNNIEIVHFSDLGLATLIVRNYNAQSQHTVVYQFTDYGEHFRLLR